MPFTAFALFMGIAMSVTAFPVLARILTDRGLQRTRLGSIAIARAAIDDITAWRLLALVVAVARARLQDALWTLGASAVLAKREEGRCELSAGALSGAFVAVVITVATTPILDRLNRGETLLDGDAPVAQRGPDLARARPTG